MFENVSAEMLGNIYVGLLGLSVMLYAILDGYDLGVVRMNGFAQFGGGRLRTLDDVTLYDEPFDEKSFLVQVLGIPEPTSLAVLGLGGLLLTRRRRGA